MKLKYIKLYENFQESIEDISFKFSVKTQPKKKGVILHEIIEIEAMINGELEFKFAPYHLVWGESSMAIFDAFGVNETAGLIRSDCQKYLDKLELENKTETSEGAFIAGLCNVAGNQIYQFFNVARLISSTGMTNRVITHESLHMARLLITLEYNEFVKNNIGKADWWKNPKSEYIKLDDENEELFAETLERVSAIAFDRWEKVSPKFDFPEKSLPISPLKDEEYKRHNTI